jgi:hypothetical protein
MSAFLGGWRGSGVRRLRRCWSRRRARIVGSTRWSWGEFERAFTDRQFERIARLLRRHGVLVWLPEAGGSVDLDAGQGWNLRSVAVILANPRYTGRQVWSRQRSVPGAGRSTVAGEWVISRTLPHPALVSGADFVAVQQLRAARKCKDGATHTYVLAGLVQCRLCGRRMDSHWVNGRAGYRCRHGHYSAQTRPADAPRNLYVREDELLARLGRRLVSGRHGVGGDVEPSTVDEIVARLRAESTVIVCGRVGWTLAAAM